MFRDIVDNKIAAGEVGKDLKRVADTLVETVTETEKTVDKNVSPATLISYNVFQHTSVRSVRCIDQLIALLFVSGCCKAGLTVLGHVCDRFDVKGYRHS